MHLDLCSIPLYSGDCLHHIIAQNTHTACSAAESAMSNISSTKLIVMKTALMKLSSLSFDFNIAKRCLMVRNFDTSM